MTSTEHDEEISAHLERRAALIEEHGLPRPVRLATAIADIQPEDLAGINPDEMIAFAYPSRESARAWHKSNADHQGHDSLAIRESRSQPGTWIGILKLNARKEVTSGD